MPQSRTQSLSRTARRAAKFAAAGIPAAALTLAMLDAAFAVAAGRLAHALLGAG